eukprot:134205_1
MADNEEIKIDSISKHDDKTDLLIDQDIIFKKIRNVGLIKTYLAHFLPPNISLSTVISCFLIAPFSIILNIGFICYNFYILNTEFEEESLNKHFNRTYLKMGNTAVVWFEFIGLSVIMITICILLIINYLFNVSDRKCMVVDCLKQCASWSTFKLFYNFSPRSLVSYYSVCYSHHRSRLNEVNIEKYKTFNKLREKISDEIEENNVSNINIENKTYNALKNVNKIISDYNQSDDFNQIYKETFSTKIIQNGSWIIFILITVILLTAGMTSLLGKLAQFQYINDIEIENWSFTQYYTFIAFCNQLWNICNEDKIKMDTIYRFIFMEQNGKYTRFISNRIAMLDSVIKQTLCDTFNFRGLLLAISMDSNFLHKLIVQDTMDEFSITDLIEYKTNIQEKNLNANDHNDASDEYDICIDDVISKHKRKHKVRQASELKELLFPVNEKNDTVHKKKNGKWKRLIIKIKQRINYLLDVFKMKSKQQPLHPYILVESEIQRYNQKMHCNEKQRLFIKNDDNINYNAYSLINGHDADKILVINTNKMKNISLIFEKIESIIKSSSKIILALCFLINATLAGLAVGFYNNRSDKMMSDVCRFGYLYCVLIGFGAVLAALCMCINQERKTFLQCHICGWVFAFFSWFGGSVFFLVYYIENDHCINEIIENGPYNYVNYYFYFLISCWISLFVVSLVCMAYLVTHFMIFAPILLAICMLAMIIYMDIMPYFVIQDLVIILKRIINMNDNIGLMIVLIVTSLITIWYLIYTILYFCWRKNYNWMPCKLSITNYSIIYIVTVFSVCLANVIHLIVYYNFENFPAELMSDSWSFLVFHACVFVVILIMGSGSGESYLESVFYLNWLEYWQRYVWMMVDWIKSCKADSSDRDEFSLFLLLPQK